MTVKLCKLLLYTYTCGQKHFYNLSPTGQDNSGTYQSAVNKDVSELPRVGKDFFGTKTPKISQSEEGQ